VIVAGVYTVRLLQIRRLAQSCHVIAGFTLSRKCAQGAIRSQADGGCHFISGFPDRRICAYRGFCSVFKVRHAVETRPFGDVWFDAPLDGELFLGDDAQFQGFIEHLLVALEGAASA